MIKPGHTVVDPGFPKPGIGVPTPQCGTKTYHFAQKNA